MNLINPTGKGVRSDAFGIGDYGARRRKTDGRYYSHKGIDFICEPGQRVYAPAEAVFERIAYPYSYSQEYSGALFVGKRMSYKLFYIKPTIKTGAEVKQGQVVGIAQDISAHYDEDSAGNKVVPHVHFEITGIDPFLLNME